jgi:EAL domain-containing protein (putative c-di-GMP-specific phosphodiesterase class I)/GGDEF domain-containing protein
MSFYTEEKEREHRFVLALRMGLPIFLLFGVGLYVLVVGRDATTASFIFLSLIFLVGAIYFILFLIYQSTYEAITDTVTHTFSNDYFSKLFYRWSKKNTLSVIMITVDNLTTLNKQYGITKGNRVLLEIVHEINEFFTTKKIKKLPICRYKGGDFILLLQHDKEEISPFLELFLAKYQEKNIDEMEVKLSGVLMDTKNVKKYEEVITRLYEILYATMDAKYEEEELIPEQLEKSVLEALRYERYSLATQVIHCETHVMEEVTFKLKDEGGKLIHQGRFVPLLNRLGKMREYESYLLKTVVTMAAASPHHYVLSLSSVTLRNGLFFQHALETLQHYPEAKNKIILLFDEKEYSPNIKRFSEQIAHYRAAGYKIALDRYGGNHIAMMYLKEFAIDFVRFDPLYVHHIHEENYQNILYGLNLTAHLCKVVTWMNMIEDAAADTVAQSLNIDCRQGNYYGKITPKEPNEIR